MEDQHHRLTLVFNGMIYNYRELRRDLEQRGETFRSATDTEVVLRGYAVWGPGVVHRLQGMFAFAIWDATRNELFLARDPLGIKPLYFVRRPHFAFASQVRAFLDTPLVRPKLSLTALGTYLAYGSVHEPATIFEDIESLPAGHTATLRDGHLRVDEVWSAAGVKPSVAGSNSASELRALLEESVRRHLISDAPIGVFLSGGLDSTILALLAARETTHLHTVSVDFSEHAFSEGDYMREVASLTGGLHEHVHVSGDDLRSSLGAAFLAMDQPTVEGLNSFLVSRAAAMAGLKVALSGLGADELFNGYGFARTVRLLEAGRRLPGPFRAAARAAATRSGNGSRGLKAQSWFGSRPAPGTSYDLLRRVFIDAEIDQIIAEAPPPGNDVVRLIDLLEPIEREVTKAELDGYLKNTLLRDTDSMSMAQSLEVRVPYLDQTIVEWTLGLGASVVAGKKPKQLLREATADLVPASVRRRPKQGFVLPLEEWMRGELKKSIEDALVAPPEELSSLIRRDAVLSVWRDFNRGEGNWARTWSLFALSQWIVSLPCSVGL